GALSRDLTAAFSAPAPDVATAVSDFFAAAAEPLRETDYADACPIATVALEVASTSEPLRQATADVFESWITAAAQQFAGAGISPGRARALAISTLAILEGAFILSRATRSTAPVEIAGAAPRRAGRAGPPPPLPCERRCPRSGARTADTRRSALAQVAPSIPEKAMLSLERSIY